MTNEIDDSPYLIYPSNHLVLIFVPTPYNDNNFATWKSLMETTL